MNFFSLVLCSTLAVIASGQIIPDQSLGYYAFEKASSAHGQPPRVRKPPYMQANVPCTGALKPINQLGPKDALCGDLNRGYVPLNPLNQLIQNQPYPFELIKNKTLMFLARSLPFLQQEIVSIPKIFRVPAVESHSRSRRSTQPVETKPESSNLSKLEPISIDQPNDRRRSGSGLRLVARVLQALESGRSTTDNSSAAAQLITNNHNVNISTFSTSEKKAKLADTTGNHTEPRQKVCEPNDGILCHVMQLVTYPSPNSPSSGSSPLLNTLTQTLNMMNTAQSFSGLAQLLTRNDSTNHSASSDQENNRPLVAQVLNAINSLSSSSSPSSTSSSSSSSSNGSTPYNPLGAIFEYFTNGGSSSLMPARRKKPLELEDIWNGFGSSSGLSAAASAPVAEAVVASSNAITEPVQISANSPTACPAIEEYVAPVYARNYQGIWKYVVQIPHEGYFTQTVQKTSCVKGKCDYMDGYCKEATRWVSLLVAEVYYPNAKFGNTPRQPLMGIRPVSATTRPTSSSPIAQASHLSNNYAALSSINTASFAPLNSAQINPATLNSFVSYAGSNYPTSANAMRYSSYSPAFGDYNHYDTVFNRRTSAASTSSKQPKLAQRASQSTTNTVSNSLFSGYSPQYLQQLYQQLYSSHPKLAMRSDASTSPSSYPAKLFSSLMRNNGQDQKNRLSDLHSALRMRRSLNDHLDPMPTATYAGDDEIDQESSSADIRALPSGQGSRNANLVAPGVLESSSSSFITTSSSPDTPAPSTASTSSSSASATATTSSSSANGASGEEEECDGYDVNGCYVIRVYYDWFLVPGSCKCWKRTSSGSFDTLKRIFIGK